MFEKLKELVKICGININLNLFNKINVTRDSGNTNKAYHHDEDKKELILNYDRVSPEAKRFLDELQKAEFEKGGIYDSETKRELDSLYNYKKSSDDDNRILAFFKPVIPKEDYQALEVSLYLKKNFGEYKSENVKKIKDDIRRRFGDRGNNISNLCTAGYFHDFFRKLYESSSKEKFKELYEVIVSKAGYGDLCSQSNE